MNFQVVAVPRKPDRREHVRFKVLRPVFVMLWPASSIHGQITDISLGGLAFRYYALEKPQDDSSEIEIMVRQMNYSSGPILFETITDTRTTDFVNPLFRKARRKRGVRFKQLTKSQQNIIATFIENYCWKSPYQFASNQKRAMT